MQKVLSILVENTSGVLSHVSGLFSRRGYNIDSFSAGVTADPRFTRMTIVTSGDELILDQIEKQLSKLEDVVDIKVLSPSESVTRELMLVKIKAKDTDRQSVLSITEIFHGKVVDVTKDSMVIEVTGHQDKLASFLDMLGDYQILELARTGLTGLTRGLLDVVMIDEDGKRISL
ncbi:MAG: acetolactate synthase small subunit [Lachnospiraceae bacterium]|nr:acetolactate synthase small subunit [Lachnospiraceae bacterium]MBQ2576647.1 acetolactate synthase small subunit [Lachnospiraceae bacterium]MCR4732121.1 acetolactate synthase small subunit [Lachnospiraceae bacterium]